MKKINRAGYAAITLSLLSGLCLAGTAQAQPGWGSRWGGGGWGSPWNDSMFPSDRNARGGSMGDAREGKVEVSRFVAQVPQAQELGHGAVSVASETGDGPWVEPSVRRTFEAAIVDALVGAGYDTQHPDGAEAQVTTLKIARMVLVPAEEKKSPISGTAAVGVSNYGTSYGLGINVDLTKPRTALVSTRLDARITDKASGAVLWEGYATIATREGDQKWSDGVIAAKLAGALFDQFPKADPVTPIG
ncbi:hypothetical protein [Novosphingobium sp. Rr 2-17]|uniref:hypothetical protein n=1 Tax=Novosphingobium sp. Rr 2-17 TaxID=555793 RepID=UPI0005BE4CE4|nr:hypothetical protein [Novosphingobium sp. Rr 2-17]